MGSAAAYHLARRGRRVLGLDRFSPPHEMGSSHGQSRIIREAYFEDPAYVPLVQRAYLLWEELEHAAGTPLLFRTGGLMIGYPDGALVTGALRSARTHGLAHEILSHAQVAQRFPALRPEADMVAVHEPRAGVLYPEACIAAHLALAARHGAVLHPGEAAESWSADAGGVRVATAKASYRASCLILAAGAWMRGLLAALDPPLAVERQVLFWFAPRHDASRFAPARCPIHLWQFDGERFMYGFPDLGEGVKIACHHQGYVGPPESVVREVDAAEVERMRGLVRRFLPDADGALRHCAVCLYTNTPDEHFWIDRHPEHANVVIASACSGHGFKFSSVVGEILAALAGNEDPGLDLGLFRTRWDLAGRAPGP